MGDCAYLALVVFGLCSPVYATINPPSISPVSIPVGTPINGNEGATLDNFVSQDLFANTTEDWTAAAIVINLTAGSIYQDTLGAATGPAAPIIITFGPSAEFDSYVTNPAGFTSIQGSAGDLGDPVYKPDETTGLSLTWDGGGTDRSNIGSTHIGRFTLSDDAHGFWSLAVTEAFNPAAAKFLMNPIQNGQMIVDPLQGDLNFDGFVGIDDLNTMLGAWNNSVTSGDRRAGDPSGDGFVGIEDLNIALGNWNAGLVPLQPGTQPGQVDRDTNEDGYVGIDDQNLLLSNWNLSVPPGDPRADVSGDGFIGIDDKVNGNWNAGTPPMPIGGTPPSVVVPEPGSIGMMSLWGMMLVRRRR